MSDRDGAPRPHEAAPLGRPDTFGLDPQSYTAQRLQHATPHHLHVTTRRCFIGPVPESWLAKHRKSWYQYRPRHMQSYASRTASFTAGSSYAEFQRLSGLDGTSSEAHGHSLSFPQPKDLAEDRPARDGDVATGDGAASPRQHGAAASRERGGAGGSGTRLKDKMRGKVKKLKKSKGSEAEDEPASVPKSTGQSFVTANEYPEGSQEPQTPGAGDREEHTSPASSPSDSHPSDDGNGGRLGAPDNGADGAESTAPLLSQKNSPEGKDAKGTTSRADNKIQVTVTAPTGETSEAGAAGAGSDPQKLLERIQDPTRRDSGAELEVHPQQQPGGGPSLRQLDPVSTGLVRFNLPADTASEDTQRKTKVSEARFMKSLLDVTKARAQPGQLLKAERMLVRVDATPHDVPADYSELDSLRIETRLVAKWREYIVVCRRSPEAEDGLVLRMEKTRVIPVLEGQRPPKAPAYEVALNAKTTKINMYSSLDKTIVMWAPWKKDITRIYTFRPRSFASSVEWYTFLHTALGWKRSASLTVHVPYLNMTIDIEKPFEELRISKEAQTTDGESNQDDHAAAKRIAEGQAAQYLIDRSLEMLRDGPSRDIIEAWINGGERIGLAWKRYDRLEWVHGANEERMFGSIAMAQTHDLELRTKTHYPTEAPREARDKPAIEEPPAVEGFLVRLTSQQGRGSRFGRPFSKRLYYSTHNQYLCFSTPGKVPPPKPPHLPSAGSGDMPSSSELAQKLPKIYMVDPYPIADGQIAWLSGQHANRKKEHDQYAFEESERTVKALMEADGYINLCKVQHVRKVRPVTSAPPAQGHEGGGHHSEQDDSESENEGQVTAQDQATFEIILLNGLAVRLQAYDQEARKAWVRRLRDTARYWTLRMAADLALLRGVRQTNLQRLDMDEGMESWLGQFAQKWEVARAIASPELFNVCGISCCRALTLAGTLYRKPRLHGTFKKVHVFLVHGRLLTFQATVRARSGRELPHGHHERLQALELRDTYVYSGLQVAPELLYRDTVFDSNHPGRHALPRVWPADRWTSTDEDEATCFVLWRGLRKSLFRAKVEAAVPGAGGGGGGGGGGQAAGSGGKSRLARVARLGTTGRAAVFKARSRTERDRWVTSIGIEIERLQQETDIRLVPKR